MSGLDDARPAGSDLLFQDEIRNVVRRSYEALPRGAGRAIAQRWYSEDELKRVPDEAIEWALGVGNPVRHAGISAGDAVLDLGCGGGIDLVLAAHQVGPDGRVVGVDMLPEMCDRARAAARAAGVASRCAVEVGLMEAIPLPDASIDVVISNGVLNLSPRRSRVLAEVARVLKPGGRLCIADLTVDRDLPPAVLASEAAWAGCLAGAVSSRILEKKLHRAGFVDVALGHRVPFNLDDVAQYPLFPAEALELMRATMPPNLQQRVAVGLLVRAVTPLRRPRDGARAAGGGTSGSGVTSVRDVVPDPVEAPGVEVRRLKQVDDVDLKVLDLDAGGSTPYHIHLHAHQGMVVSGRGHLRLEDRREPLEPGHVFAVQPNDPHAITADEPLRIVCMDCFVE